MQIKNILKYFAAIGMFGLFLSIFFTFNLGSSFAVFSDVDEDYQYSTAIQFLQNNEVIEGYGDDTYRPYNEVNRAEFLKIVEEGLGMDPTEPTENCFPDVPKDEWYAKYVCTAKDLGWVQGYPEGNFNPGQGIKKVEALKILAKAANWDLSAYENGAENPFTDVDTHQWYWQYLAYAIDHNIIDDTDDLYNPANAMQRGQIAEYMYRDITVRTLQIDVYDPSYDEAIAAAGLITDIVVDGTWGQVANMVRNDIIITLPQKNNIVAFMWQDPEVVGTKIAAYDLDETDKQTDEVILENDTWLVFIDLEPGAMWEHETMFVFVDAATLDFTVQYEHGWPVIDDFGMWNTDEMRQMTKYWVYPLEPNVAQENIFEAMGDDGVVVDGEFIYIEEDYGIKIDISLEEEVKTWEEIKAEELAALQAAEQNDPSDSSDFASECKDLPYCKNKPAQKLALVIDGFAVGDGFAWSGLPMYKSLIAQGYDTTYLSAVVGENKNDFPEDAFPADEYPNGSDEHKANFEYTTIDNITAAFDELTGKINSCCDEVVVYISGHGSQFGSIDFNDKQTKYKVEPDPDNPGKDRRVEDGFQGDENGGSLHTSKIQEQLDKLKTCDVTVIINSCYSGQHIANGINEDFDQVGCLCRTVYTSSVSSRPTYGTTWTTTLAESIGAGKSMAESALDAHKSKTGQGYYSNFTQVSSTPPILCIDADGDGLCLGEENIYGTDPNLSDTDGDGLSDYDEINTHGTDPNLLDTDGDTLSDGDEINTHGTDPKDNDSDDDGLNDNYELFSETDPNNPDSDGDGCNDGRELLTDHTNPNDANSHAVDCGGGLSGDSGTLIMETEGSATFATDHSIVISSIDEEGSPKVVILIIDSEYFEALVGDTIPLNGVQVGIISISDGKVEIEISPTN